MNTQIIRNKNSFADMNNVLLVWVEDQNSHNILLNQSVVQKKALSSTPWRWSEVKKLLKKSFKLKEVSL